MTVMPNKYSLKRELKIINKKKINEYVASCDLTEIIIYVPLLKY